MPDDHATQEVIDYIKLIDGTLLRHLNNNMPIECLHIDLDIRNLSFSSLAEKWFQSLAFTNCLKELSLTICGKETAWLYMIPKCLKIPSITKGVVKLLFSLRSIPNSNNAIFECHSRLGVAQRNIPLSYISLTIVKASSKYPSRLNFEPTVKASPSWYSTSAGNLPYDIKEAFDFMFTQHTSLMIDH
nr:hypothetical protein [Tanacetum cinerariifolium]